MFIYLFRGGRGKNFLLLWLIIVLYLPPVAAVTSALVQLPDNTDTITADNIISVIKLVYYALCLGEAGLPQQGATQREKNI